MKYAHHLKNLEIFKNIDLTGLIDQMKALKTQIRNNIYPPNPAHESEAKNFFKIWLHAFNLTPEMVNLSKQEIKALKNYLYANRLILECKEVAVRVTPSTWEEIEDRMFTPTHTDNSIST